MCTRGNWEKKRFSSAADILSTPSANLQDNNSSVNNSLSNYDERCAVCESKLIAAVKTGRHMIHKYVAFIWLYQTSAGLMTREGEEILCSL